MRVIRASAQGACIAVAIETVDNATRHQELAQVLKGLVSRLRLKHCDMMHARFIHPVLKGLVSRLRLKPYNFRSRTSALRGAQGACIAGAIETNIGALLCCQYTSVLKGLVSRLRLKLGK